MGVLGSDITLPPVCQGKNERSGTQSLVSSIPGLSPQVTGSKEEEGEK